MFQSEFADKCELGLFTFEANISVLALVAARPNVVPFRIRAPPLCFGFT
jgi:hypothetical protein